ncbi:hypothetical protein ACFPRL_28875 [Pseudoclavibacter helvolus]
MTLTVTAKAAAIVRNAPPMMERMMVSRVDRKILLSPASIMVVTRSFGLT